MWFGVLHSVYAHKSEHTKPISILEPAFIVCVCGVNVACGAYRIIECEH